MAEKQVVVFATNPAEAEGFEVEVNPAHEVVNGLPDRFLYYDVLVVFADEEWLRQLPADFERPDDSPPRWVLLLSMSTPPDVSRHPKVFD